MNRDLAPTYQRLFGSHWVLWYEKSNIYSIVEPDFKHLLDTYLSSNTSITFGTKLGLTDTSAITEHIQSYIAQCHTTSFDTDSLVDVHFKDCRRHISKHYACFGNAFQVNFDTDLVEKTIHPSIAHLEMNEAIPPDVVFDIYLEQDQLCLFKDELLLRRVPKKDYHLIQGKFVMELLSFIHHKNESDWIGTFHGSTISDGTNAILLIGASGKGKSTLSALLVAHGFEVVADDVSPLLFEDKHIYYNPSAISLKKGAFEVLTPLISSFDRIPETLFNKNKGSIKYFNPNPPLKPSYPCKALIMVNYSKGKTTTLKPLSVKVPLETLIPDSWLSPNPKHAQHFLDWLEDLELYQLTYSDTQSVIEEVSSLFKTLRKP
ncbi:MAG: hypothetical protein Tsb0033_25180 [Winogradskyella sp.]